MGFPDGIYIIICAADGGTSVCIPPFPGTEIPVECINGPPPTHIHFKHIGGDKSEEGGPPIVVVMPEEAQGAITEWAIDPSSEGLHRIHVPDADKYWTGTRDAPIMLKGDEGARNQEWDIKPAFD
ncbi:hypothetical protein B0J17DRAFT_236934 [Rhizoctonia solani]|nr:hypothetical protein B0J17DRAFT_236934 [Rhizoctonia solani]